MRNTKAELPLRQHSDMESGFIDVIVWRLPEPMSGSTHSLTCRHAQTLASECVLRYDSEAGAGDHRHDGTKAMPCLFASVDRLLDDFLADVGGWRAD